jgi:hypothetical protein
VGFFGNIQGETQLNDDVLHLFSSAFDSLSSFNVPDRNFEISNLIKRNQRELPGPLTRNPKVIMQRHWIQFPENLVIISKASSLSLRNFHRCRKEDFLRSKLDFALDVKTSLVKKNFADSISGQRSEKPLVDYREHFNEFPLNKVPATH